MKEEEKEKAPPHPHAHGATAAAAAAPPLRYSYHRRARCCLLFSFLLGVSPSRGPGMRIN